ncbi:MAG: hypothetical protein D6812_08635 [Deltaproteobacteria bacterium]|nr:MAG: hypothetical protein D6812_08635 [Deltaproteobacteria bacterium]
MKGKMTWRMRAILLIGAISLLAALMGPACGDDECGGCPPGFECQYCFQMWQCMPEGSQC